LGVASITMRRTFTFMSTGFLVQFNGCSWLNVRGKMPALARQHTPRHLDYFVPLPCGNICIEELQSA
jgi:hypothetical protein